MKALRIISKPATTEKSTRLETAFTYTFLVNPKATKIDVKQAIEEMYDVEVAQVRIINTPAKKRTVKRMLVDKRPSMKKAFITLKGRKKLDITKFTKENAKK